MRRSLLVAIAALALTACDSSSTPTQPLAPATTASRNMDEPPPDAVPDSNCRSGWSVANGRCW